MKNLSKEFHMNNPKHHKIPEEKLRSRENLGLQKSFRRCMHTIVKLYHLFSRTYIQHCLCKFDPQAWWEPFSKYYPKRLESSKATWIVQRKLLCKAEYAKAWDAFQMIHADIKFNLFVSRIRSTQLAIEKSRLIMINHKMTEHCLTIISWPPVARFGD